MQICKYAKMQICKYANIQTYKFTNLQIYKYASMQLCKYANIQACKYFRLKEACLQVFFYASTQISCKNLLTFNSAVYFTISCSPSPLLDLS